MTDKESPNEIPWNLSLKFMLYFVGNSSLDRGVDIGNIFVSLSYGMGLGGPDGLDSSVIFVTLSLLLGIAG